MRRAVTRSELSGNLSRRTLLAQAAASAFAAGTAGTAAATTPPAWRPVTAGQQLRNPDWPPSIPPSPERPGSGLDAIVHRVTPSLRIACQDTGERFEGAFRAPAGAWIPGSLASLSWLARDWRENLAAAIDVRLWYVLAAVAQRMREAGDDDLIVLLSGYRTQRTNRIIPGSVRNSMHCHGRALDVAAPAWPVGRLYRTIRELQPGGCGWYDRSAFVHLDTGRERFWSERA